MKRWLLLAAVVAAGAAPAQAAFVTGAAGFSSGTFSGGLPTAPAQYRFNYAVYQGNLDAVSGIDVIKGTALNFGGLATAALANPVGVFLYQLEFIGNPGPYYTGTISLPEILSGDFEGFGLVSDSTSINNINKMINGGTAPSAADAIFSTNLAPQVGSAGAGKFAVADDIGQEVTITDVGTLGSPANRPGSASGIYYLSANTFSSEGARVMAGFRDSPSSPNSFVVNFDGVLVPNPEPGSLILLSSLSLAGLGTFLRRRKNVVVDAAV